MDCENKDNIIMSVTVIGSANPFGKVIISTPLTEIDPDSFLATEFYRYTGQSSSSGSGWNGSSAFDNSGTAWQTKSPTNTWLSCAIRDLQGTKIYGIKYRFDLSPANRRKKVSDLSIQTRDYENRDNESYVTYERFSTAPAPTSNNSPRDDFLIFDEPLELPYFDTEIRFYQHRNYGDQFNYTWVTDYYFLTELK